MRQIWIPRLGDPSVLEVREAADPQPKPGEVRIAVEGSGVNFADLSARMGLYGDAPKLPMVVGYEVAGTVDAIGDGVDAAWLGAPVVAMTHFGGYSSAVCCPADTVSRRPPGMDAIAGAAIPVAYITAWMMLEVMGRVRAGDRVLVHSAGGGVGLAALDLLKWRGAVAIGTASPGKHAWLRDRGFDEVYGYDEIEPKLTNSLDLALDAIGGKSWGQGLRLLRPGGRLVCYGFSSNQQGDRRSVVSVVRNMAAVPWLKMMPLALINENKGVLGVNMGHMWDQAARCRGWLDEIVQLWKDGVVRPVVHATVPFANAAEAHRILHARENLGKVILTP